MARLREEGVPVAAAIAGATGLGVQAMLRTLRAEIDRASAQEHHALKESVPWMP
jgi:hypothetical protein